MAYLDYEFSASDTYQSIAEYYGITVTELIRINNLPFPPASKPSKQPELNGTIKVPELYGTISTINVTDTDEFAFSTNTSQATRYLGGTSFLGEVGFGSQRHCMLDVESLATVIFPCFPESYSDSHEVHFSPVNILGRSEPFQVYQNSGPRQVSVSFKMHKEMCHTTPIEVIVGTVQGACYPLGASNDGLIAPRCTLWLGKSCVITGIMGNVSTDWSETIIDYSNGNSGNTATLKNPEYSMVSLSFSITECTGNPRYASDVMSYKGRGSLI